MIAQGMGCDVTSAFGRAGTAVTSTINAYGFEKIGRHKHPGET